MLNLKDTDNIIFDLGNVIIDIDPEFTIEAFRALGALEIEDEIDKNALKNNIYLFEKGGIVPFDFFQTICNILMIDITFEEFVEAWNKTLLGIPEERKLLLKTLSKNHNLFLLSNTNEIHIRTIFFHEKRVYPTQTLFEGFIKDYYSNQLSFRKTRNRDL